VTSSVGPNSSLSSLSPSTSTSDSTVALRAFKVTSAEGLLTSLAASIAVGVVGVCAVCWAAVRTGIPASSNAFFFSVARIWFLQNNRPTSDRKLGTADFSVELILAEDPNETHTVRALMTSEMALRSPLNRCSESLNISISRSVHFLPRSTVSVTDSANARRI
jgi:hypothetical protein